MTSDKDAMLEEIRQQQEHAISMMSGDKKAAREFVANFLETTNRELQQLLDGGMGGTPARLQVMRNNICIEALREG